MTACIVLGTCICGVGVKSQTVEKAAQAVPESGVQTAADLGGKKRNVAEGNNRKY